VRGRLRRAVILFWRLSVHTTKICLRYRVTGLAAEAGFFALLSLPPLVLGLVGAIGFVGQQMGTEVVADLRPDCQEDGVERSRIHFREDIMDAVVAHERDAHCQDAIDLPHQSFARKTVRGYAVVHHPARLVTRVADFDIVSETS
jgi:hypothetical protein